jgi:membrane carboxypeptidase/penicillin-binding protein
MRINFNEFDREITLQEGLKKSTNIAQVKEIRKLIFKKLAEYEDNDIVSNVRRCK